MRRVLVVMFLLSFTSILLIGCKGQKNDALISRKDEQVTSPKVVQAKALSGKKVVMIISPDNFRDEELAIPLTILANQGASVKIASQSMQICRGMLDARVDPDMPISDIKPDQWDALILIGGPGSKIYWDDPSVHAILKDAARQDKIIGAICLAPVTCANAGVLVGKKATVFETEASRLKDKGAEYTGASVQRDGKIITASGPPAAKEFGDAIAAALKE